MLRFALPLAAALAALALTGTAAPAIQLDGFDRRLDHARLQRLRCSRTSTARPNLGRPGTSATVNSHYRRILAANPHRRPKLQRRRTAPTWPTCYGQVQRRSRRRSEYVTVLMGANDVCASSEAAMTPVADFRAQFEQAMAALDRRPAEPASSSSSIPDVYQLWRSTARSFAARSCGRSPASASRCSRTRGRLRGDIARRHRVRQRNIDYNTQLAQVCAAYVMCRFDGNAVFNTRSRAATYDA